MEGGREKVKIFENNLVSCLTRWLEKMASHRYEFQIGICLNTTPGVITLHIASAGRWATNPGESAYIIIQPFHSDRQDDHFDDEDDDLFNIPSQRALGSCLGWKQIRIFKQRGCVSSFDIGELCTFKGWLQTICLRQISLNNTLCTLLAESTKVFWR